MQQARKLTVWGVDRCPRGIAELRSPPPQGPAILRRAVVFIFWSNASDNKYTIKNQKTNDVDHNTFSNSGQLGQFIFGGISAICAVLSFIRSISTRYRYWSGGIAILAALAVARLGFVTSLPQPWADWIMVVLAIGAAYFIGRFGTPRSVSTAAVASAPLREPVSADPVAPIELLRVKLSVSKDESVQYKKKLLITLRNVGQHDIIVGPKTTWVPGAMRVNRLEQQVWELEPQQGWDSDGWRWQSAEHAELYVSQGLAFRTWVALHENASEAEIEQLRGRLGTLRIPLRVKVGNRQISI